MGWCGPADLRSGLFSVILFCLTVAQESRITSVENMKTIVPHVFLFIIKIILKGNIDRISGHSLKNTERSEHIIKTNKGTPGYLIVHARAIG